MKDTNFQGQDSFVPVPVKGKFSPHELAAVSEIALLHMERLSQYLFPRGVLGPDRRYWYDYGLGIKISFDSGGFFDLNDPECPRPFGNPLMLWLIAKGVPIDYDERGLFCASAYQLRKAVVDLGNWVYRVENGIENDSPSEEKRDIEKDHRMLKEQIGEFLLEKTPELKGTARQIWKRLRGLYYDRLGIEEAETYFRGTPELANATHFLTLLSKWARYRDRKFFSVREQDWHKRKIFTLTRPLRKGEVPEIKVKRTRGKGARNRFRELIAGKGKK